MKRKSILFIIVALLISIKSFAKDPGDKADDFTLKNIDGTEYTLSKSDSKFTVIMFWSTECPYVQPYNDRINDFVKEYSEKGISFWGINSNSTESPEKVAEHSKNNNYIFPMLKDLSNNVADSFGATRTPEVFVIDNNMIIMYHGRIEDNSHKEKVTSRDLKNALDELLAGKDVSVKTTKSFGCTIKRVNN